MAFTNAVDSVINAIRHRMDDYKQRSIKVSENRKLRYKSENNIQHLFTKKVFDVNKGKIEYKKIYNIDFEKIDDAIASNIKDIKHYLINHNRCLDIISHNEPLILDNYTPTDITLLNSAARVLRLNGDVIIDILRYFEPKDEFKIDVNTIENQIKFLFDFDAYTDYKKLGVHSEANTTYRPEIRYICRWNYFKLLHRLRYLNELMQKYSTNEVKFGHVKNTIVNVDLINERDTLRGMKSMMEDLSAQHRFGTFPKQIKIMLDLRQARSESDYLGRLSKFMKLTPTKKDGIDLVCMQYLRQILFYYRKFPFHIKDGKVLVHDDALVMDIQLPIILHCLLNGAMHEFNGNLTHDTAKLYVNHLLHCAHISVSNESLNLKSKMREWIKLAYSYIRRIGVIKFDEECVPSGVELSKVEGEFWLPEEKEKLISNLKSLPAYYLPWVNKLLNTTKTLCNKAIVDDDVAYKLNSWFSWMISSTHLISNFSIYHKTSLFLEYEKSVEPKLIKNIPEPKIEKAMKVGGVMIPYKYDWASSSNTLYEIECYMKSTMQEHVSDFFINNNMESVYVTTLTNKSGGIKAEDMDLPEGLQNISHVRLIKFALDRESYEIKHIFMQNVCRPGKCTIRYQIDRRSRLIIIVSNEIQTLEIMILSAFNQIKKHDPWIAVGKQVGNICDAKLQLKYSGDLKVIKCNSDFKGMDAHMRPVMFKFMRHTLVDMIGNALAVNNSNNRKFFAFNDDKFEISTLNSSGNVIAREKVEVPALVQHQLMVLNNMYPMEMLLNDRFFNKVMIVNEQTFQSGFFGTSANHTEFSAAQKHVAFNKFILKYPLARIWITIMGDDIFQALSMSDDQAYEWMTMNREMLEELNFEIDEDATRFFGVFLQQACFCGSYVPYSSRMSIFCDEKSENVLRHPVDMIKIMNPVVRTYCQRSMFCESHPAIVMSIWNNIRDHRENIHYSNVNGLLQNILNHDHINRHLEFFSYGYRNDLHYLFPYVLPYCSPISVPLCPMITCDVTGSKLASPRQLVTSVQGDIAYSVINSKFYKVNDPNLTVFKNGKVYITEFIDIIDWQYRNALGFTLSEYLLKFSRVASLHDKRLKDIGINVIDELSNAVKLYLPKVKLERSNIAKSKLSAKGIPIPPNLSYENLPKVRIEQSILANVESNEETGLIDSRFAMYVTKFNHIPDPDSLLIHALCSFRFVADDSDLNDANVVSPSIDGCINNIIPFLPSYNQGSDYALILYFGATPLRSYNNVSGSISAIHAELGTSFNIESAVDYGLRVYQKTRSDLDLSTISEAMGMSMATGAKYVKLVQEVARTDVRTEYKSIFEHGCYFNLSGWVENYSKLATPSIQNIFTSNIKLRDEYFKIFTRDLLFAFGNRCIVTNDDGTISFRKFKLDLSIYTIAAMTPRVRKLCTNGRLLSSLSHLSGNTE